MKMKGKPSGIRRLLKISTAFVLGASLLVGGCGGGSPEPCGSGTDVRNLKLDGEVSEALNKIRAPGKIIAKGDSRYPLGKLVVIRAALADWPSNSAATGAYVETIFFSSDSNVKSIRGYFATNSYGQLHVTKAEVPPWITLSKNLAGYSGGIEGSSTFMRDVLDAAEVDWDAINVNGDDIISRFEAQIIVLIPNAMPPPNATGFASTRYPSIGEVHTPSGEFDFSTRPIVYYSLKAVADPQYATDPIRNLPGVAHELCHAFFNLPDRYAAGGSGTGLYDLMASSYTWVYMTAFDRMKIGWTTPKVVQGHLGKCLQFTASELQEGAVVLVPPGSMAGSTGVLEYWIAENRNKAFSDGGYDDDLPDAGLAVWYVAEGTWGDGHDDVRLVDFSKPDQDPDLYKDPGGTALFKLNPAKPKRLLMDRNGGWSTLFFQNVSDPANNNNGLFMFGEF